MERILDFDPTARAVEPRLRCPIPPEINPHAMYAQAQSARWAVRMGLVSYGTAQMGVFERARFAWLVARCYPRVSAAQLRLLADWATLIFFFDDLGDSVCGAHLDRDDGELVRMHRHLVEALATGEAPSDDAYCHAMVDIRRRLTRMIDATWFPRLAEDLELYLQGVRWEHAVERSGRPLTLAIYRHMRPLTSAVNICLDLAGAFECPDDPTIGREPLVRELERIANNHISWVNDIFSLDRERAHGQTANLVVALATSEGRSLREALDRAIELCNEEMEAFTRLEGQLRQLGVDGAEPYVTAMARWIRGSIDWHTGATRYVHAQPLTVGVDPSVRDADAA